MQNQITKCLRLDINVTQASEFSRRGKLNFTEKVMCSMLARSAILFAFLVLANYVSGFSQRKQSNATYNTHINKAEQVQIEGGKTTIIHADTVIEQSLHAAVYYYGSAIQKDTSGVYTTLYYFNPKDNPGVFKVDFVMTFDQQFIDPLPNHLMACVRVGMQNLGVAGNANNTAIHIYGQITGEGLYVRIRSKAPLFTKIEGVAGRADPNILSYTILSPSDF